MTPITPNAAFEAVCPGRNLLVSMYYPGQLGLARSLGSKLMADHGRFSTWMAAMKMGKDWCDDDAPRSDYYQWLEPWIWDQNVSAIMPDIPGAPSQINDSELLDWPFPIEKGLPVYHMDGPINRFGRLLEKYPRVCMGWIGHPKKEPVGCSKYWDRVTEIEAELGSDIWSKVHMLRGIAVAFELDFAGADSSSLGQNGHRYDSGMDGLFGEKWRGRNAYADKLEGKNGKNRCIRTLQRSTSSAKRELSRAYVEGDGLVFE